MSLSFTSASSIHPRYHYHVHKCPYTTARWVHYAWWMRRNPENKAGWHPHAQTVVISRYEDAGWHIMDETGDLLAVQHYIQWVWYGNKREGWARGNMNSYGHSGYTKLYGTTPLYSTIREDYPLLPPRKNKPTRYTHMADA